MISKKCLYALKAVLALARDGAGRPMTIQQIADAESIPARFLEAILRDLKQSGLTESVRGKDGGYRLSRPPRDLSAGEVIRAVEGPWLTPPPDADTDVFSPLWESAASAVSRIVDDTDFQTLVLRDAALRAADVLDYTI